MSTKLTDYHILTKASNLGFYNSCEVTSVFLIDKKTSFIYNYYLLVPFQENELLNKNIINLFNKPIPINDKYKLGICQYTISLSEMFPIYKNLLENNIWEVNENKVLLFNKLKAIPKKSISIFLNSFSIWPFKDKVFTYLLHNRSR